LSKYEEENLSENDYVKQISTINLRNDNNVLISDDNLFGFNNYCNEEYNVFLESVHNNS
jgi:hypothetical protein